MRVGWSCCCCCCSVVYISALVNHSLTSFTFFYFTSSFGDPFLRIDIFFEAHRVREYLLDLVLSSFYNKGWRGSTPPTTDVAERETANHYQWQMELWVDFLNVFWIFVGSMLPLSCGHQSITNQSCFISFRHTFSTVCFLFYLTDMSSVLTSQHSIWIEEFKGRF